MSSEPGAPAPSGFIPLSVPELRGNEWNYVKDCIDTGWVSSVGAYVERFEHGVAARAGTRHAVATVNGTCALHTALLVAGIKPGDEVITSTLTFIAPANAIRYAGAWPVFMDAEPGYWQLDVGKLSDFLERGCQWRDDKLVNRATDRPVRAILPVHILGHPVDMDPILELARRFELTVIEDASECIGAAYKGRRVGSMGDLACFSFNGNKIITTGGGGMITTNDPKLADKARYLTTQAKDDPVEYIHGEIGYNYRLTNVLAALGCAQLEKLDEYIARKREMAAAYSRALGSIPGLVPMKTAPWAESISWLFSVEVDAKAYGLDSREILQRLAKQRIQTRPLWQPMHRSPAHAGGRHADCPVADNLYARVLSLPCSVGLPDADLKRVVECLREVRGAPAS
jgi:perosamine synthetase